MIEDRNPDETGAELVAPDDAIIGRAFWWSVAVLAVAGAAVGGILLLTVGEEAPRPVIDHGPIEAPPPLAVGALEMPVVRFTDVTAEAGIDFVHTGGARGEKLLPETMGGGCAFFDLEGDGDPDLLLVNGTDWPHAAPVGPAPTMALYRNDGAGRFENVTSGAGLDRSFYGQGVAVADYDGDGDADVFVTALGPNRLFRNDGGTFVDVSAEAGVEGGGATWSTSAGFLDYDRDGHLDLFVCNYVAWSRGQDLQLNFTLNGTDRAYGPPKLYEGTNCALYRNRGDGRFDDVSTEAGIEVLNPATGKPMAKALATTFVDVDGDGFLEILVANDTVQNFVFRNLGDGTFEEIGALTGVAFDGMGAATGAMGIDVGDFRNDGAVGVGIGNFANESTSLYLQQPGDPWQFAEVAGAEGVGSPSRLKLSFGLFFFDYDLDGRLDLLHANGHLEDGINEIQPSQHYRQPAQLFWNRGSAERACFAAVPDETVGDLSRPIVGRGAAFSDVDGDGDLDVLLTQAGGAPLLLRNDQAGGGRWLRVRLEGAGGNRDAIGAIVEVMAGGTTQRRRVMPTRSYLSQVERVLTFGLGSTERIERVRVVWPDGTEQDVSGAAADGVVVVRKSS